MSETSGSIASTAPSWPRVRQACAGAKDFGAPGPREIYHPGYYGAFLLDPDGNNVEAVCHAPG